MNLQKKITVAVLLAFITLVMLQANAQPGSGNKQNRAQRIDAQRVAFITNRLQLTPAEAQAFWPVYNEFDVKRHELSKNFHKSGDVEAKPFEQLTDKEATELADNQLIEAQKLLDLRKEYHAKFKSVLPSQKVLGLYQSEREFQKQLIDRLRNDRGPGQGRGDGKGQGRGIHNRPGPGPDNE